LISVRLAANTVPELGGRPVQCVCASLVPKVLPALAFWLLREWLKKDIETTGTESKKQLTDFREIFGSFFASRYTFSKVTNKVK